MTERDSPERTRDRELGLFTAITRRDVLHGMGVAMLGTLAPPWLGCAEKAPREAPPDDYPPALTGLRGSHPGSFEAAHARARNGAAWPAPEVLDERYDLIVVGGGISGLAAAHYYRAAAGADKRILILDNHDDFGGHAKRNEFQHDGRTHLAFGGSVFLEYTEYSDVTNDLLRELGVDIAKLVELEDPGYIWDPVGLGSAWYFDADSYGTDKVIPGPTIPLARTDPDGKPLLAGLVDAMPLSGSARRELSRFLTERTDYLPEIPDAEKLAALDRISYRNFLVKRAGLSAEAAQIFHRWPQTFWGVGTDAMSASSGLMSGMPGLRGLGGFGAEMEQAFAVAPQEMLPGAIFADGNASIARLLTRELVPSVAPGRGMEDIVPARFDYAQLDHADAPVRIRLSSTAVHVNPLANDAGVDVTYVRGGKDYRVRARCCVLACYHNMIPFLCPTLPETQKRALRYGEKTPLMSSNVLLRSGRFLERSGLGAFYAPGRMHSQGWALGRCLGRYQSGWNPDDPMVLQLFGTTIDGPVGASMREQYRAGRHRMLAMSFEDFEREIRIHLGGMLGGGGFDAARDILAITVNRWPHGYAYDHDTLFDPDWPEGQAPNEIGRRRFGPIAIANSDAAWSAYVDAAIDQAHRAVDELVKAGLV